MTIGGIDQAGTSPISRSAMMNATSIAIMNRDPACAAILDDPFAEWFATAISDEAHRVITGLEDPQACRDLIAQIEAENAQPGISTHHLYRKPWVTGQVREALTAGATQIVILGAGLDTLSIRLEDEIGARPVFEIDTPEVITYRRSCITAHRELPENVRLVPVDFEREHLAARLAAEGYDPALKTVFLAEGVIEWLAEDAVRELFAFVRERSAVGSRFIFSFMPPTAHSDGALSHIREDNARSGEVWKFALRPEALKDFVSGEGLRLLAFADPAAFERGRAQSAVGFSVLGFLHFVSAETGSLS